MELEALRELYDREQRIEVHYPDTRRDANDTIVRHVITEGRKQGWVLWSKLDENSVEAAIIEQTAYFDSISYGFEWKAYSHDQPSDLKARLVKRGFIAREPADAIMVLDLEDVPDVLLQPVPPAIRRVTTPEGVQGVMGVLVEVWNEDFTALGEELTRQLLATPEFISMYAAEVDGRLVSGAWTHHTEGQFSGLWGGSTLEAYRKRGLYTGLLAVRAAEARERGKRFLTVDASPMSRPILEKFGFICIATATACEWNIG